MGARGIGRTRWRNRLPESQAAGCCSLGAIAVNKAMAILLRPTLRRSLSVLILAGIDTLALFGGLAFASYVVGDGSRPGRFYFYLPSFLVVWLAIFTGQNLYAGGPSGETPGRCSRP